MRLSDAALFADIKTLAQFKQLKPGQLHSWSDTLVLQANSIEVIKGTDFEGLFGMLSLGRFDYFPRSILEVEVDYKKHQNLTITVDKHILIYYPTAFYFYVAEDNEQLAHDLLLGLEAAHLDGTFQTLFNQYYGQQIKQVRESKRRIISLNNPLLPKETPLERKELWINFD